MLALSITLSLAPPGFGNAIGCLYLPRIVALPIALPGFCAAFYCTCRPASFTQHATAGSHGRLHDSTKPQQHDAATPHACSRLPQTRLIDDTLSDAILNGRLARGATAYMDVDSDGAVTVCDKAAVTTVAGHDSGYNGRIRIEDYRESNGSGSGPGSVKGAWAPPRNPVPVDAQQRDY